MNKEDRRKRDARHKENVAKKYAESQDHTEGRLHTPPLKEVADNLPPFDGKKLDPIYPWPDKGFQPLSPYLVERITKAIMKHMKRLAQKRHIPLDLKYWENITRAILGQPSTDTAVICTSPAGSGKSTWILAFLLAIRELFAQEPELADALVGVVVVLQKVDDLNELADTLNEGCPPDEPFMAALQGWSTSGKLRGFCLNSGVDSYEDCLRSMCPHADQCQILMFHEKAPHAPVVGLTQERFYLLRQGDGLSTILQRTRPDGNSHPRRYILFDEKYLMAPVTALSTAQINEASTEFNDIIQKYGASDTHVRGLQQQLDYAVKWKFQKIRKAQQTETGEDVLAGFLGLSEEEREDCQAYYDFRNFVWGHRKRYLSKPLSAVFDVMDCLYSGKLCLFTKTNGFCIYRIDLPQIHYDTTQTIIFDATAEVDMDYCCLANIEILSGTPGQKERRVTFHIHSHPDLNVSKRAMKKSWKLPAFGEYLAEVIREADCPVFLCTYKESSVELADRLEELLKVDFNRVLLMPDREPAMVPYFNGTNGSNSFKDAEMVVMLGYPRLDPSTYLAHACAACGEKRIADELAAIPEETRIDRNFNVLDLPSVHEYVTHHLAARLEQEIYRCAQRNPGFTGKIDIHLFCPPKDVLAILRKRILGQVIYDEDLPDCVARWKGQARQYEGGSTSFGRLVQFFDSWDGSPLHPSEIQERTKIGPAVWKDLMGDPRTQSLLRERGVVRSGRGPNARWSIPGQKCA